YIVVLTNFQTKKFSKNFDASPVFIITYFHFIEKYAAKFFLGELPFQDRLDLGFSPSGPSAEFPIPDQVRLKRSAEKLLDDGIDASQNKEKKAPRKFLGLRGKKAPSSFLGMRGRREDSATDFSEREFPYGDVYYEDLASPLDDNELG
ncbi:Solute carrier family 43 member 3, partial [Armadillidium vulgare]